MTFHTNVEDDNVWYLYENDGKVLLNQNWIDNNFNSDNPALRLRNSFISPT